MAKPIIKPITPFDATQDFVINIVWNGNRSVSNRIIIVNAKTLDVAFDNTVKTYSLTHVIPANTLINGCEYIIQAQTFDQENLPSVLSNKVNFYTFTNPDFYFYNLPDNNLITSASYEVNMYYYSPDWESIDNYRFYLYDSTKKELLHSDILYDDMYLNYIYRGLDSDCVYYFRCVGVTLHGMPLDTGYVEVRVKHEQPGEYSRIYAVNNPKQGCINISSNLIIIDYNGDEVFEYENGMINLMDKTLVYDEGFNISGDFTVIIRGMHLWQTNEIFKMKNTMDDVNISSRIYSDNTLRFKVSASNGVSSYIIYSEPLRFTDKDMITLCVRRIDNIYQIKCFEKINYVAVGNFWYGFNKLSGDEVDKCDTWFYEDSIIHKVNREDVSIFTNENELLNVKKYDLYLGNWR